MMNEALTEILTSRVKETVELQQAALEIAKEGRTDVAMLLIASAILTNLVGINFHLEHSAASLAKLASCVSDADATYSYIRTQPGG